MAIRDKMEANAQPFLNPGERVQAVFGAQTQSQWLILIFLLLLIIAVLLFFFINEYRVIVVTNQRILVTRSGRFSTTPVNEVIRELPRSTQIGPAAGLWYKTDVLGEKLYIHKRFHKDIAAADAGSQAGTEQSGGV